MPLYIVLAIIALLIFSGMKTVQQGNVAVVTVFGKYRRVIRPGLNLLIPSNSNMSLSGSFILCNSNLLCFKEEAIRLILCMFSLS